VSDARSVLLVLHDVSPASWADYRDFVREVDALGAIPITWLVVPDFHKRHALEHNPAFCQMLEQRLTRGDELALHGYYHCDNQPPPRTLHDYFMRRIYTWEGEFYELTTAQAHTRLEAGIELFQRHSWPLHGFVAPAWLMSQGSREALRHLPLDYTTDAGHFYRLPDFQALPAPGIVWSARTAWRRGLSKFIGDIRQWQTKQATTLRLGLHPVDMRHDFSRQYWLQLLQQLLDDGRQPMTKFGWLQDQGFCLPGSSSRTSIAGCKLSHSSAAPSNSVPFSGVRASGS
jgi:predicted deacetylase